MLKFVKQNFILLLILFTAAFFFTFRLHQTFVMAGDTARDLIDIMNIWQNKIITIVGEPVNTISNNPTQVLFPSLYLYTGLAGLLLRHFDPVGSVLIDNILTLVSIPLFYLLSNKLLKKKGLALVSTFIYSLSPVTVALTRSFWEPNIEIPLSVFAWFFFLYKDSWKNYLFAGIISGIIFDIHYMNIIPIALYIFLLLFRKDKKYFWVTVSGFILAISPLIAFEIKNHFFLTKAFIGTFSGFSTFSQRTLNPFISIDALLYIFGLGPYEYFFPSLFNIGFVYRIILDTLLGISFVFCLVRKQKILAFQLVGVVLLALLESWYFEKTHLIGIRYILTAFPLFVISFVDFISSINKYLLMLPLIPMLILSTQIITHKLNPTDIIDYYPLSTVEEISKAIISDNPTGKYNVTENILGDARSLAFRYYLLRDAKVKPQAVEIYDRIDTLYVITPSLDKTYKESRWEFVASGPKKIIWEKDFGDLKLYKFVK